MRRTLFGFVATLLALAVGGSVAQANSALVGEWNLDEGGGTAIADSSGLGNNGTLTGNVSWVPGVTGSALSFDGVSGAAQVPDASSLEPPLEVSVGAWVKNLGSPGDYRYILAKGGTGCIAASYGLYTGPNGGLEFYIAQGHGSVYARSPDGGSRVWDGKWHLAVGTFDGTTIRLYVDGVQIKSGTFYPGALQYPLTTSNDLFIGSYPQCQSLNPTFLGEIDEVTVWDQALSPATVKLMAGGDATPPVQGGSLPGQGSSSSGAAGNGGGGAGHGGTGALDSLTTMKLLAMTPSHFAAARSHRRGRRTGTAVSYVKSKPGRSTFAVLRRQTGIRKGGRCVRSGGAHRPKHSIGCFLYVTVGRFSHSDHAGRNRFHFSGQIDGRTLSPGMYLLTATPSSAGGMGRTASTAFWILP